MDSEERWRPIPNFSRRERHPQEARRVPVTAFWVQSPLPPARRYLLELLRGDDAVMARAAEEALVRTASVRAVIGRQLPIPAQIEPNQSLQALGVDWVPDYSAAQRLLLTDALRFTSLESGLSISSSQPAIRPSDQFVSKEPLLRICGSRVFASASLEEGPLSAASVLALGEGYPPGVVCVHSGSPEAPTQFRWFCMSAFDGESFLVWEPAA